MTAQDAFATLREGDSVQIRTYRRNFVTVICSIKPLGAFVAYDYHGTSTEFFPWSEIERV